MHNKLLASILCSLAYWFKDEKVGKVYAAAEEIKTKVATEFYVAETAPIGQRMGVVEDTVGILRSTKRLLKESSGNKIRAIKEWRAHFGCGLKDAKDAIEELMVMAGY